MWPLSVPEAQSLALKDDRGEGEFSFLGYQIDTEVPWLGAPHVLVKAAITTHPKNKGIACFFFISLTFLRDVLNAPDSF